jgi:hypothetical protein
MAEGIQAYLEADHQRMAALLAHAGEHPDRVEAESFWRFRLALLRHIGMEERVLFPAARRARGGEAFPWAARLRADHGQLAALLVPTPTVERVARIAVVLELHNRIEEGSAGAYADCEAALGEEGVRQVLAQLRAYPVPPPAPYFDRVEEK